MTDILMTYLPLLIAATCAIFLGIWIVRLRKEKRKEFLSNILRLVVATLLSFSIALFSQSLASKWKKEQVRITMVARLASIYNELGGSLKSIERLGNDYTSGSVQNIQFYLPRTRHLDGFVGCESYYGCSLELQTRLGDTLHEAECLMIRVDQTSARVADITNIREELAKLAIGLERCRIILEEVGKEIHEPTWEEQLGISANKGIVGI